MYYNVIHMGRTVSIRLNDNEEARVVQMAGNEQLGSFMKSRSLEEPVWVKLLDEITTTQKMVKALYQYVKGKLEVPVASVPVSGVTLGSMGRKEEVVAYELPAEVKMMLEDDLLVSGDRELAQGEYSVLRSNGLKWIPTVGIKKWDENKNRYVTVHNFSNQ